MTFAVARRAVVLLAAAAITIGFVAPPASAAPPTSPVVLHQGVVTRQDIPAQNGSEPDTVAEPDVAVSPRNDRIAIAVAHDSRFASGGAVTISVAWTANGGTTWHHHPVRGITKATGGPYQVASDPVVAFGPGGRAYMSVLLSNPSGCASAIAVLGSGDGGRTWSKPSFVHRTTTCVRFDDKDWLVVDNSRHSPHRGRLYVFWSLELTTRQGAFIGAPQVVRWSDDAGRTWSKTAFVTPRKRSTQNSQPMILANGDVVDIFLSLPLNSLKDFIVAARSTSGGRTWSKTVRVTADAFGSPSGVRCCLFAADIDPVTHLMYVAWERGAANGINPVFVARSRDGVQWSAPTPVSRGDRKGVQRVNVDVVARGGRVYVSYGTRTHIRDHGGVVQQQLSVSSNRASSFGAPISLGPRSVLRYSARAQGHFPGDYIGAAISAHRLYLVWAVSSKPRHPGRFHQVIYGATLRHG